LFGLAIGRLGENNMGEMNYEKGKKNKIPYNNAMCH